MKFIFDLDGTLTSCETLPVIARQFGVDAEIDRLTHQTVKGDIPFMESFVKRVGILGRLDVSTIAACLADIPIHGSVLNFILDHTRDCVVATGNYRGWVSQLLARIPCTAEASEGEVDASGMLRLNRILRKEQLVKHYQDATETVVFIGDGNNDAEAMRLADISIACGLVHAPAASVMQVADYAVYSESALIRLLTQIASPPTQGASVVISAAGVGSRLGLGQTKSLIQLHGKPLIAYQLEAFAAVDDVRIVVGYQARDLIEAVLARRKDVIFALNHDYFHTKTATSLFLGARHANDMVVAWDGDLLVHPEDITQCLDTSQPYVGISSTVNEDAVFATCDALQRVIGFSRQAGTYEWSGPACLSRAQITYSQGHVYDLLTPLLPLPAKVIRAQDIDTYQDYTHAQAFVASWRNDHPGNVAIHTYYDAMAARISSPTETRNKTPDFSAYDVALVQRYAGKNLRLLDLGSGTGLLLNPLADAFGEILAIEKYSAFTQFIQPRPHLRIVHADLQEFVCDELFDRITAFGVMNFFNTKEAEALYRKIAGWLLPGGIAIIKHQMGVREDVLVNGFSQELQTNYYSEYRHLENEKKLLEKSGLVLDEVIDIYPAAFNRWDNTHFYALAVHRG